MPNIPTFDLPSGQSKLQPQESGAQATMRAARITQETAKSEGDAVAQGWRAIGHTVSTAGKIADDYVTQRDIASAAEQHTLLAANAATALPTILANSPDPVQAVKDYYEKTYAPAVDKINEGMNTKRSRMWAAEHSQSGSQQFMRSGIAEAMSVQGAKAIQSFQTSVDNLGAAARANPHEVEGYIKQADSLMDGMKGSLSAQQQVTLEGHRSKVRQQLMISAGHALADKNPAQFKKDLEAGWGKDHLDPHQRELMTHYADYTAKRQNRIAKGNSLSTISDWVDGKIDKQTGQDHEVTPEDIGRIQNDPNVHPDDKKSVTQFGVAMNRVQTWMQEHKVKGRGVPPGDAGRELDLRQRLGDPDHPTTLDDITDALNDYAKNPKEGINPAKALQIAKRIKPGKMMDLNHLNNDPILKGELDRAGAMIRGKTDAGNQAVKDKHDTFKLDTLRELQGALDRKENVKEYLDPKNPKYLFTPERIKQYTPTKEEIADQIVKRPPSLYVKPGESQFLQAKPAAPAAPAKPQPKQPIGDFFGGMFKGGK